VEKDGVIFLADPETGEEIFYMPSGCMEDAGGKFSDKVAFSYETLDGGDIFFTVTADEDFLQAEDTVYPVRIDPTWSTTTYTYDTFCSSKNPTTNYNSTAVGTERYYLRTGYDVTYFYKRRTFIDWTFSGYEDVTITYARLDLYVSSEGSTSDNRLYEVTGPWNSMALCWNNMPSTDSTGTIPTISGNQHRFIITSRLQDRLARPITPDNSNLYGFCIKDTSETTVGEWTTYYSTSYTSDSVRPRLYFTYTTSSPTPTPTPTPAPTNTPMPTPTSSPEYPVSGYYNDEDSYGIGELYLEGYVCGYPSYCGYLSYGCSIAIPYYYYKSSSTTSTALYACRTTCHFFLIDPDKEQYIGAVRYYNIALKDSSTTRALLYPSGNYVSHTDGFCRTYYFSDPILFLQNPQYYGVYWGSRFYASSTLLVETYMEVIGVDSELIEGYISNTPTYMKHSYQADWED
jgi:hypothetical protein